MTAVKDFIVAIELGSSKLTGMAGKRNSDGSIQIFAYAREEASAFIRKGIIYNINKTVLGLTSIINKLEEQLEAEIAKVYVGIGGQSLHSEKNFVVEHLPRETAITPDIVNQLIANNRQTRYPDRDILDVIPQEYKVKNTNHLDPVGIISNEIEGHFLNIVARTSVKRNIITCFEQAGIEIAGFFISPLVLADAVLQENEMRLGCALIDCGADTTTVAIYKQGLLRHLAVIPLGGNNITKDICSLQIEEEDAEMLKCTYGSGFTLPDENSDDDKYPINESRNIQAKLLNEIVGARTEEIVANVRNQIMLAGYSDKLTAGYVLTGGGANLRNLQGAFMQKGKYIKIRIAGTVNMPIKATEQELYAKNGRLNTLFALVAAGKENCYRPEPVASATDLIEQMQQKEHEEQEREAARREAEERERKEREAAAKAAAAEEEARKRKAAEEARVKANTAALAEVKSAADNIVLTQEKLNEALKEVKKAQEEKDSKAAHKANISAIARLKEIQGLRDNASTVMDTITDEAYLSEARVVFADIEAATEAAERVKEKAGEIAEKVKRENSFFGKLLGLGDIIMND